MPDGTPTHDAMAVRIPFEPDREKVDEFLAAVDSRLKAIADTFVKSILDGLAVAAPAPRSAPEPAPRDVSAIPLPSTLPKDIADEFRKVAAEFSGVKPPREDENLGQQIERVIEKLDIIIARLTGGE